MANDEATAAAWKAHPGGRILRAQPAEFRRIDLDPGAAAPHCCFRWDVQARASLHHWRCARHACYAALSKGHGVAWLLKAQHARGGAVQHPRRVFHSRPRLCKKPKCPQLRRNCKLIGSTVFHDRVEIGTDTRGQAREVDWFLAVGRTVECSGELRSGLIKQAEGAQIRVCSLHPRQTAAPPRGEIDAATCNEAVCTLINLAEASNKSQICDQFLAPARRIVLLQPNETTVHATGQWRPVSTTTGFSGSPARRRAACIELAAVCGSERVRVKSSAVAPLVPSCSWRFDTYAAAATWTSAALVAHKASTAPS
eukprot:scaffold10245_cov80-Phaeocystis_antarctica.AAC.3